MPGRTKRKTGAYTEIGERIAALAETQGPIAQALGVGYWTVSKKLRGKCSIFLADLEALSRAFKVPMTYFVTDGPRDPGIEALLKRVRSKGRTLKDLMVLAGRLSTLDQEQLVEVARTLRK